MEAERLEFLTEGPQETAVTYYDEAFRVSASLPGEHFTHSNRWPRNEARPSSVSTHGLSVQGGL